MRTAIVAILIVAAGVCLWLYTGDWTKKYQEQNCAFRVSGIVLNALSRRPLSDVEVRVWCREAKTSDHKLRGKPLSSTNYVVNTDADGAFRLQCSGGSISLEFTHEGFDEETSWSFRNRESRFGITTNLVIELKPKR